MEHEGTKTRSSSALCLFLRFFVSSCSVKIHPNAWGLQKAAGFVQKAPPFFQKGPGFDKKAAGFERKGPGFGRKSGKTTQITDSFVFAPFCHFFVPTAL